jgi:fructokinase
MTGHRYKVVGMGEILWDMLPDGKQLGGAPANFAYISTLLGDDGIVASRVGSDSLGSEAVRQLAALGVTTEFVEHDAVHPTGTVQVQVDHADNQSLRLQRAWPGIFWNGLPPARTRSPGGRDLFWIACTASRGLSRATIRKFREPRGRKLAGVFDVNLRQAFFSEKFLTESMKVA